VGELGNPS